MVEMGVREPFHNNQLIDIYDIIDEEGGRKRQAVI